MNSYKLLSLDESGKASFTHQSSLFILTGVVFPEKLKSRIDTTVRKLKKKYFGNEDIVFHGRNMARGADEFEVLKDPKKAGMFWSEFVSIVNRKEIALYFVLVDKMKARKAGWGQEAILKRAYVRILSEFARNIKSNKCCGKIINESDPAQDGFLIYAHNRLQGMGTGDGSVTGYEYKRMVTSLCLVNKANLDADIQIADVVGPVAGIKYLSKNKLAMEKLTTSEKLRLRLIDRKIQSSDNPGLYEVLI